VNSSSAKAHSISRVALSCHRTSEFTKAFLRLLGIINVPSQRQGELLHFRPGISTAAFGCVELSWMWWSRGKAAESKPRETHHIRSQLSATKTSMIVCEYYLRYDCLTGNPATKLSSSASVQGRRKPVVTRIWLVILMQKHANKKSVHILYIRQRSPVKWSFSLRSALRVWLCIIPWILRNSGIFLMLFGLDPTFPNRTSQVGNNNYKWIFIVLIVNKFWY
jgi:hypothetical protein